MTILSILQCTNFGGLEQATYRTMRFLRDVCGASFKVATPGPFGAGAELLRGFDGQATDFRYRGRFGWRDFPEFSRHVRCVAAACDSVWISGASATALAAARLVGTAAHRPPIVLSHHHHHFEGGHFEDGMSWLRWRAFYETLCRGVSRVVYATAFTRDEALRIAPWLDGKATVIHPSVQAHHLDEATRRRLQHEARLRLGLPTGAWIVGNSGWIIQRKRFDVFLRTAREIRRRIPDSHFVICGAGDLEDDMRRLASDLGLDGSVRFAGWVDDLTPYYQAWDVALFNSDHDALGLTPLEAAAWGGLVVASVVHGGLGEFVEHGRTGFLFRRHDPERLADAVVQLARGSVDVDGIRRAATAKLIAEFSPEETGAAYARLLG